MGCSAVRVKELLEMGHLVVGVSSLESGWIGSSPHFGFWPLNGWMDWRLLSNPKQWITPMWRLVWKPSQLLGQLDAGVDQARCKAKISLAMVHLATRFLCIDCTPTPFDGFWWYVYIMILITIIIIIIIFIFIILLLIIITLSPDTCHISCLRTNCLLRQWFWMLGWFMPILILGILLSLGCKGDPKTVGRKHAKTMFALIWRVFFPLDEFEVTSKLKCKSQEVEMHPR